MPAAKSRKTSGDVGALVVEYRGKHTRTGNSSGFRFEGALFKSHPEFNGPVKAQILAPGRMLVTAENPPRQNQDPAMAAFLAFLAQDIAHAPQSLRPLDEQQMKRIGRLTKGVQSNPLEDLGDSVLL